MADIEHVSITIRDDFMERQTRAEPVHALSELVWNSLDGDASKVSVDFEFKDLAGGLSKIIVADNGDGFSRDDAPTLFGNLGGSWKRNSRQSRMKRRVMHGQEGKGRYKAFALGSAVDWHVSYVQKDKLKAYSIKLLEGSLTDVAIGLHPVPKTPS